MCINGFFSKVRECRGSNTDDLFQEKIIEILVKYEELLVMINNCVLVVFIACSLPV